MLLADAELILFVDGSGRHNEKEELKAGYVVCSETHTRSKSKMPTIKSAQAALTRACKLAEGKRATTIYLDSLYMHKVCFSIGATWNHRGF